MHRDIQRRQAIFEDSFDVALLHIRQRREVPVGERESVVVVAHVKVLAQSSRQSFDEAKLAAVRAAANGGRHELHADCFTFRSLDLVDDLLAAGQTCLEDQLVVRREELPIEEIAQLAAVHRQQFGPRNDLELFSDASRSYLADTNHWLPENHQCNGGRSRHAIFPQRVHRSQRCAASAHAKYEVRLAKARQLSDFCIDASCAGGNESAHHSVGVLGNSLRIERDQLLGLIVATSTSGA